MCESAVGAIWLRTTLLKLENLPAGKLHRGFRPLPPQIFVREVRCYPVGVLFIIEEVALFGSHEKVCSFVG